MKFTDQQERLVREFLAETDALSDSLPASDQRRVRNDMRKRLREAFNRLGDAPADDATVRRILEEHRAVAPRKPVPKPVLTTKPIPEISRPEPPKPESETEEPPETDETRVWAGVCVAYGDRLGIDTMWLRSGFVILGLLAAPLAFLAYAGLYLVLRYTQDRPIVPKGDVVQMTSRPLLAMVQLLALFLIGWFVPLGVIFAANMFLPEFVMNFGPWGWYVDNQWPAFLAITAVTVPMAFISALPLRYQWDKTLHLFARLCVALYACLIAFGIASALTGAILRIVEHLMQ